MAFISSTLCSSAGSLKWRGDLERKLFTLNSGHAICAYLGTLKGYKTIVESIADPAIGALVHQAMYESGEGLIRKFDFDPDAHHAYIERIFARFQNPFLADETARVAREPIRKLAPTDRLLGEALGPLTFWQCSGRGTRPGRG